MFIGHFGVALAGKRLAPRASLGSLFFAAEFLDLLWPVLLLAGVEHVRISPGITKMSPFDFYDYPISHSLLTVLGWSLLAATTYFVIRRYFRGAVIIGVGVLSHWVLDFLVHRPDLPLWPHGPRVGLGLWNHTAAAVAIELAIFAVGVWIYLLATEARDRIGLYGFWILIAVLFFGWVSTLLAGPPPSERATAIGSLAMWLLIPWAWWTDRHRVRENRLA
jgi:hypothetical protein